MRIEHRYYSEEAQEFEEIQNKAELNLSLSNDVEKKKRLQAENSLQRFWDNYNHKVLHTGYLLNPDRYVWFMELAEAALTLAKLYGYNITISDEIPTASITLASAAFIGTELDIILPELIKKSSRYDIVPTKDGLISINLDYEIYEKFSRD